MFSAIELFQRLLTWWHERDIERRIRRYGWTAIYVGDYHSAPTWTYTLGLSETLNGPELLVFDVTQEIANTLFWDAYEDIKSGVLKLEDGSSGRRSRRGRASGERCCLTRWTNGFRSLAGVSAR